ncbi:aminoglycoside phosphotransferase family protein, partial [Cellulomonas septica]|nr:aminoglycoside phosphotransferase family protein [Cellulomonas septica]
MDEHDRRRATAAATAIAASLGLAVDEAVVLHASNKLTLRLLPCDTVARVAPAADQVARLERS